MRSLGTENAASRFIAEDVGSAADLHRSCFACGHGEDGMGLTFEISGDNTVSAQWFCEEKYQSYPGIVHGGIIATILDCAMTNCLLIKGIAAVTADMHIEYIEPLRVGNVVMVTASLTRSRSPLFLLDAEVLQNNRVSARASAKFMSADIWSDESKTR